MSYITDADKAALDLVTAITTASFGNRFEEDEKRSIRDPHTGRIIKSPDYGSDEFVNVQFSAEKRLNKAKTFLNGGVNVYDDMDFITITTPGDKQTVNHRPATDFDQWRFPFEYEAFKRGDAVSIKGTPLSEWPELQPEQITELEHHGVRTVEQLANLNDSRGALRIFLALKGKAQTFLGSRKSAEAVKLENELAESRKQMADMQEKLDKLMSMLTPDKVKVPKT